MIFTTNSFIEWEKPLPFTELDYYKGVPCLKLPKGCFLEIASDTHIRLHFPLKLVIPKFYNTYSKYFLIDKNEFRVRANRFCSSYIPIRILSKSSRREQSLKITNFFIHEDRLFISYNDCFI